jgi:hypothetical protein
MIDYDAMSDSELSFKVHLVVNEIPEGYATISLFDINNPSDMVPIVFENNITIELSKGSLYEAYGEVGSKGFGVTFSDTSLALRAAAICFLKMMEAKGNHG